jgi:hypothetical protein
MPRRRRVLIAAGLAGLAALLVWWLLRPPDALALDAKGVSRVEVEFEPWGEDMARQPGGATGDREAIAALVQVVRSGRETTDHKCGSRGTITFQRPKGRPVELRFLPGHHAEWYEFRSGGKVYRVPRAEFVAAMRRVGVDVPLRCQ